MTVGINAKEYELILRDMGTEITVPKGKQLSQKNVYYLKRGVCALTYHTEKGDESSYLYFKSGTLMNFLRSIVHSVGIGTEITTKRILNVNHCIRTKTECTLLGIDGEKFMKCTEEYPELNKLLLRSVTENLINLLALSTGIVSRPAGSRVCQLLLDFMSDDTPPQFPRYLTYNEIAFHLSMHVITVTKILKALKDQHIISKRGQGGTILNPERLRAIAHEEEELVY